MDARETTPTQPARPAELILNYFHAAPKLPDRQAAPRAEDLQNDGATARELKSEPPASQPTVEAKPKPQIPQAPRSPTAAPEQRVVEPEPPKPTLPPRAKPAEKILKPDDFRRTPIRPPRLTRPAGSPEPISSPIPPRRKPNANILKEDLETSDTPPSPGAETDLEAKKITVRRRKRRVITTRVIDRGR